MLKWNDMGDYCEGSFKSEVFRDDEGGDILNVAFGRPELSECAERCVESFNSLTEEQIDEICAGIAESAGREYAADNPREILKSCWFTTLYVNMRTPEDEIAYVAEGEGDWGDAIGFAVEGGEVTYVGTDYFECMTE